MPLLQEESANSWAFDNDYPEGTETLFEEALTCWDDGNEEQTEALFKSLLLVVPNHIDALHHLAMLFASQGLELEAYLSVREAVRIGLEGIPAEFSWHTGQMLWGHLDNRPFLRAYYALGLHLQAHQGAAKAAEVFTRLVSVNPNDNLGARYVLMQTLLDMGDWTKAAILSRSYPEDIGPDIAYSGPIALLHLGEMENAKIGLERAVSTNRRVAMELLKTRHARPASEHPGYMSIGGAEEAFDYWERNRTHWARDSEALHLLQKII